MYHFYNQQFVFLICHNVKPNPRVDATRKLLFGRLISRLTVSSKAWKVLYYISDWSFSNHFTAKKRCKKSFIIHLSMAGGTLGFPPAISKQINAAGWASRLARTQPSALFHDQEGSAGTATTYDPSCRGQKGREMETKSLSEFLQKSVEAGVFVSVSSAWLVCVRLGGFHTSSIWDQTGICGDTPNNRYLM